MGLAGPGAAGQRPGLQPAHQAGRGDPDRLAGADHTATGTSTITVTASGNGLTRTAAIALTVNPAQQSTFSLSASPGTLSVTQGGTSPASTIGIARTGYTSSVSFTTSPLPSGVAATFSPASTAGNGVTVTFTATGTAATGSSAVTITGTGATGQDHQRHAEREPRAAAEHRAVGHPDDALGRQGASGVATVSIARTNFTGAVTLSTTTPAPAGVTVTFGPATTGNSATVTIAASSTAAVTSFALAVTGTGTGVTGGTTLGVNITSGNNNTGGATATPVVATGSPWYNEEDIRLDSTGTSARWR